MSQRFPTDWMWAQACELIDEAERMHRQFFRLAAPARTRVTWEPPVDVFEDEREVVVLVALPGVPPNGVEVTSGLGAPGVGVSKKTILGDPFGLRPCEIFTRCG